VLSRLFLAVFGVSRVAFKSLILNRLYVCHGRGRGFEPRRPRHKLLNSRVYGIPNVAAKVLGNLRYPAPKTIPNSKQQLKLPLAGTPLMANTAYV